MSTVTAEDFAASVFTFAGPLEDGIYSLSARFFSSQP